MIKRTFNLIFLIIPIFMFAQDTLKRNGWGIKLGTPVFFPTAKNYDYINDDSKCKISDGFYSHFTINPILTFGKSIDVFRYQILKSSESSEYLLSYGIGYKQSIGRVNYFGYYTGGSYFQYSEGSGYRIFKQNYIQPNLSLYYKRNSKKKKYFILTGLNLSADFSIATTVNSEFKNYPGASTVFNDQSNKSYRDLKYYYPDFYINYEIGVGFPLKDRWLLIPNIKASILNINNIFDKKPSCSNVFRFEQSKQNFSTEIIFGITIIQNYKNK